MASQAGPPREHLELLYQASLDFNSTLDPERLLPQVFDRAIELLDAEAGSIWIREGETLRCALATGPVGESVKGVELPVGAGIVGHVARSGEVELVADARGDERFVHQVDEATGFETRSLLVAPLEAKGEVLGVLQIINKLTGEGRFDEGDRTLVEGLAATAGLALRNAQLHQAERRARDLETLLAISRELTATLDTDRLALTAVNLGSQAISYDRAAMGLVEGGRIKLRAISGQETLDPEKEENRRLRRLMSWLSERDQAVYVPDLQEDTNLTGSLLELFGQYLESRGVRSLHLVPLEDEQGRLGALYFESTTPGFLGEGGREAAALLANQTSVALRNAELHSQVPLIGFLEPVAEWRQRLTSMPRRRLLTRVVAPIAVLLLLLLIPWGDRVDVHQTVLRSGDETPVRAQVPGVVEGMRVEEGGRVARGDLLGTLRQDELDLRIQEAEANRSRAERALAAARSRGDEAAARLAELEEDRWTTMLEVLRERKEHTALRAPISGTVLTRRPMEKVGEQIMAGETVVLLGTTEVLELRGRISDKEIERIEAGDDVRFRVPAHPGKTFVTQIDQIAPYADAEAGNPEVGFMVRGRLRNEDGRLRPGMEAEAKVVGRTLPVGYLLVRPLIDWIRMHFWR